MPRGGLTEDELVDLMFWAGEVYQRRYGSTNPACYREGHVEMAYRQGNIHEQPKAWGQNWTCTDCGWLASFRVPLTEAELKKTQSMMGGTNHTPTVSEEALNEGITERLESLGYLEM